MIKGTNLGRQWKGIGAKSIAFYTTDEEVDRWLAEHLPADYAPYYVVGADHLGRNATTRWEPFCYELAQFPKCRAEERSRYRYFLWSPALTPNLDLGHTYTLDEDFDAMCQLNGLVWLWHGCKLAGANRVGYEASRLIVVGGARNLLTGEEYHYLEYVQIFNSLQKEIRKALRYSTIETYTDGTEWEDTRRELWTLAAVRAYEEGRPYFHRPGRLLEEQPRRQRKPAAVRKRRSLKATWQYLRDQGYEMPENEAGQPLILDHMPNYDDEELGLQFFEEGLEEAEFAHLTMQRTFFGHSKIERVSFRDTDLHESRLCWNDWLECDFKEADLTGADLRGSRYVACSFVRANLTGADLRRSGFEQCDFTDAKMQGTRLTVEQGERLPLTEAQRGEIAWTEDEGPEPPGG
jgi:hypothetical protein